jgi:murein DD-endopeptidase MepM/ murein hydrolase activator NlpD
VPETPPVVLEEAEPEPKPAEPEALAEPPPEPAPPPAKAPPGPISAALPSGFHNPMPGGVMAGYQADTGLDIAGSPRPVYAIAAGTLDYSEPGHTLWTGPSDTANCVRFELDTPIDYKGRKITHVYYAHLSKLAYLQREGDPQRRHIEAGELLGASGIARHSPHLHIGLLLDGDVSQRYWGTFLLADEIRKVLGGYKNGDRLPAEAAK